MLTVSHEHIEIVEGASGPKARIAGSRVRVIDIVTMNRDWGMSVDEIVDQLPAISHADVHAALAYYWDHQGEIEAAITEEERFVEEFKRIHGPGRLAERLSQVEHG